MIYVDVEFNLKYTHTQSKWLGCVTSTILSDRILYNITLYSSCVHEG